MKLNVGVIQYQFNQTLQLTIYAGGKNVKNKLTTSGEKSDFTSWLSLILGFC